MGVLTRAMLCGGFALLLSVSGAFAAAKKEDSKTHYPNATRSEPKSDLTSPADQKQLQAAVEAMNSGDEAKAQESAQKILDSSNSKYAKGIALQVLANQKFNAADYKGAIEYYKKLIELNSLPNDAHFDSMFNMVNAYVADEQYEAAAAELKVWREQ